MIKLRKKNVVAVLAGVAVAAGVTASAASLGGINTEWLGANSNAVVSPIENGLTVSWDTSYSPSAEYYVVDGFTVTTAADEKLPKGADLELTVVLSDGTTQQFPAEVKDATGAVEFATTPVIPAHSVEGVSAVVTGGINAGDTITK